MRVRGRRESEISLTPDSSHPLSSSSFLLVFLAPADATTASPLLAVAAAAAARVTRKRI